ncbi:hypothetical protein LshimejAT787_1502120 [Lyophyllum shimeji]|uniref:Uncharacterized protein n=1 Tax=Lyophyllum shimeji TaxID=47721 RepID=A0A9P3PYS2_LYOSH|nr:hypothetical protein LshimejAT787_1502120 [Lyophyllum shimeji]
MVASIDLASETVALAALALVCLVIVAEHVAAYASNPSHHQHANASGSHALPFPNEARSLVGNSTHTRIRTLLLRQCNVSTISRRSTHKRSSTGRTRSWLNWGWTSGGARSCKIPGCWRGWTSRNGGRI